MAKYNSNRQQNLKIGISSYTEDKTVLEITGKVGIGTTNAQYSLDVVGDINFTGTFYEDGNQFIASRWTSGDGTEIYRLSNVGIGTTNPTEDLDVAGDVRIRGGLYDFNHNVGTAKSVLISTGIGISWVDVNTIIDVNWNNDNSFGSITNENVNSEDLGDINSEPEDSYDFGVLTNDGTIAPDTFVLPSFTVSTLPTVNPAGQMLFVTDDTGGSIPAFSDGTHWRRVTDRQIVS